VQRARYDTPDLQKWVYFKLYLGEAIERCDGLIVDLLPKLCELPGIERWFFIRYLDERGFHLRLRFRTRSAALADLDEQFRNICQKALLQLPLIPESDYYPMVPPLVDATHIPSSGVIGVTADDYVPEWDKFGGEVGMPIAEEFFEVSSRIAVAVLRHEAQGEVSRKTLAPCFMQAVPDAFRFAQSHAEFWQNYSFYWLGSRTPPAHDLRERFFTKGRSLHQGGIPIVAPREALPDLAGALLESWVEHLHGAAKAYEYAGDLGDVTPEMLAFNFVHLMNNRLGLYALDEAYLAALLEQRVGPGFAA
jgi:thiopeptide-type bacteriocin biosynthesis protein